MLSTVQEEALSYRQFEEFVDFTLPMMLNQMIAFDGDCITVGLYRIVSRNSEYAVMLGRRRLQVFSQRSWAVAYAYALSNGKHNQANEINKLYEKFSRLDEDREIFEYHINVNKKSNKHDRKIMYQHRLGRCLAELESVRHDFNQASRKLGIG